jgi:hypothetical protein
MHNDFLPTESYAVFAEEIDYGCDDFLVTVGGSAHAPDEFLQGVCMVFHLAYSLLGENRQCNIYSTGCPLILDRRTWKEEKCGRWQLSRIFFVGRTVRRNARL